MSTVAHSILLYSEDSPPEKYRLDNSFLEDNFNFQSNAPITLITGKAGQIQLTKKLLSKGHNADKALALIRVTLNEGPHYNVSATLQNLPEMTALWLDKASGVLLTKLANEMDKLLGPNVEQGVSPSSKLILSNLNHLLALHEVDYLSHLKALRYTIKLKDDLVNLITIFDTSIIEKVDLMGPAIAIDYASYKI